MRSHQLPPVGRVRRRPALEPGPPRAGVWEDAAMASILALRRLPCAFGARSEVLLLSFTVKWRHEEKVQALLP